MGAETKVEDGRLMVTAIRRGTPAYEAGLDTGDEIVGFGDFRVRPDEWDTELRNFRPGDRLVLWLSRRGRMVRVTATLGREPGTDWNLEAAGESAHRAEW